MIYGKTHNKMTSLDYCNSDIVTLPPLLPPLQQLWCDHCPNLTTIPPLPPTLQRLYFFNCPKLSTIPPLPPTIQELRCDHCPNLTTIPPLPLGIQELCCDYWPSLPPFLPPFLPRLTFCYHVGCPYMYLTNQMKERFHIPLDKYNIYYPAKVRIIQKWYTHYRQRKYQKLIYNNSNLPKDVCFCISKYV
jgi:hypothetical protein